MKERRIAEPREVRVYFSKPIWPTGDPSYLQQFVTIDDTARNVVPNINRNDISMKEIAQEIIKEGCEFEISFEPPAITNSIFIDGYFGRPPVLAGVSECSKLNPDEIELLERYLAEIKWRLGKFLNTPR